MTGYSRSPRLLKGAIVAFDLPAPVPRVIPFQINPESMSRTLEARSVDPEGAASDHFRLNGAPSETIKVECIMDATDGLEKGDELVETLGMLRAAYDARAMEFPVAFQSALSFAVPALLGVTLGEIFGTVCFAPRLD